MVTTAVRDRFRLGELLDSFLYIEDVLNSPAYSPPQMTGRIERESYRIYRIYAPLFIKESGDGAWWDVYDYMLQIRMILARMGGHALMLKQIAAVTEKVLTKYRSCLSEMSIGNTDMTEGEIRFYAGEEGLPMPDQKQMKRTVKRLLRKVGRRSSVDYDTVMAIVEDVLRHENR